MWYRFRRSVRTCVPVGAFSMGLRSCCRRCLFMQRFDLLPTTAQFEERRYAKETSVQRRTTLGKANFTRARWLGKRAALDSNLQGDQSPAFRKRLRQIVDVLTTERGRAGRLRRLL